MTVVPLKSWTVAFASVVPEKAGDASSEMSSPFVPLSSAGTSTGGAGWDGGVMARICVVVCPELGVGCTMPTLSVATL